jgi:hypothetical protein
MAMDFNEARQIIEAAKKRGAIRSAEEPDPPMQPESKPKEPDSTVIPDWLTRDTSKDWRRR